MNVAVLFSIAISASREYEKLATDRKIAIITAIDRLGFSLVRSL